MSVDSLKGIEYFYNLKTLDCSHNQLLFLDLTANTALKSLNCSYNNLTRLNLSSFPAFYDLRQYIRVSPVKNQGDFGLCWTFATYASLESFLLS